MTGLRSLGLAAIFAIAPPSRARAEQCEPREAISFGVPHDGATVPPNVRFRVLIHRGCSSIPEGPPSEFRLIDAGGKALPLRRISWAGYTEMAPEPSLAAGRYAFEHRHAKNQTSLGPWKKVARVRVAGPPDPRAPQLRGRLEMSAKPVWGSVYWSPCERRPGWEMLIQARFERAIDAGSQHDQLLYFLERLQPDGRTWKVAQTFRPSAAGARLQFEWKQERQWGKTLRFRLGVRDRSGNQARLPTSTRLRLPQRPQRPARWLRGRPARP